METQIWQYKIDFAIFCAAYAAPNNGKTILRYKHFLSSSIFKVEVKSVN